MSAPSANANERRLSTNNKNAYVIATAKECETDINRKVDDSQYLTAKPAGRVRHLSDPTSGKKINKDIINTEKTTLSSPVYTLTQPATNTAKSTTQVGMDRYVTILKRIRKTPLLRRHCLKWQKMLLLKI